MTQPSSHHWPMIRFYTQPTHTMNILVTAYNQQLQASGTTFQNNWSTYQVLMCVHANFIPSTLNIQKTNTPHPHHIPAGVTDPYLELFLPRSKVLPLSLGKMVPNLLLPSWAKDSLNLWDCQYQPIEIVSREPTFSHYANFPQMLYPALFWRRVSWGTEIRLKPTESSID